MDTVCTQRQATVWHGPLMHCETLAGRLAAQSRSGADGDVQWMYRIVTMRRLSFPHRLFIKTKITKAENGWGDSM